MKLYGSVYGNYNITDALSFRTTLSGSYQDTRRTRWQGVLSNRNGASAADMNEITQRELYLIWDNFFSYNKSFGNHEISAIAGISGEQRNIVFFNNYRYRLYFRFDVKQITNATIISNADAFEWQKTGLSYVSRLNYAYDNKYLASFSFRRDGSSIFGKDFKYGNFPAASIGWNISNEDFLNDSSWLSSLKLRASYGVTGNDRLNTGSVDPDSSSSTSTLSTGNILIDYYPSLALLSCNYICS